ncbi:ATP-binding protein [Maribellus mangrovi]|uniref:ATP-binding protein n=1 Tax=Maribellus mangrovi TaxID=3133146 RepID=UPI0030EED628
MHTYSHFKTLLFFVLLCSILPPATFAQKAVLKHSYTFDDNTPDDVVGNADGVLKGGKIEEGKYITTKDSQYIELPAKLIKINSYTSLSLEAYIEAGKGNAYNTVLSYFGNVKGRFGTDYIFQSAINTGFTRSDISCKNPSTPWTTLTSTRCNPLDDGLPHHIVTTFDNKVLNLYVDGLLVDSQTNEEFPDNLLANIGDQVAYLAKSGYKNDQTWLGAIDAFNIYEGILDAANIEKSAQAYLPAKVIAVRNQLTDLISIHSWFNQTRLDTLNLGVVLVNDWKYHSGDDVDRRTKDFDDSSWTFVNSNFNVDNINGKSWEGIGWFRKKIRIDSTLYNKAVAIAIRQTAASQIYLNGKLIQSFGQIGSDSINEKLYNPNGNPFIAEFDTSSIQVIAIRYSNQKALQDYKRYGNAAKFIGFTLRVGKTDKLINSSIEENISNTSLFTAFTVFFLAFTLLNLLMFFFYSKGKENFYFALYTGSATLIFGFLAYGNISHQISTISYLMQLVVIMIVPLLMASYVFFLYTVFYKKMPRQYWLIVVVGTLISLISITPLRSKFNFAYLLVPFILLLIIEGFRVIIRAIVQKKRNALVIGTGVAIFSSAIMLFAYTAIFSTSISEFFGIIIIFSGIFSLPVTMLIYLARERAKTKVDLENRIVEVQKLSDKAIEQEKREGELKVENARKEVELKKAAELKSAYENLEIVHKNLKATQKQLIQSEKMASLGELTAGIAHEIQNPLNFVNNFSEVSNELVDEMNEELDKGDVEEAKTISNDIKQNLEKINHHGKRAESIVKGMLLHSRGSTGQKELTNINALADEYLRLSYHGFRAKDKSFNADFKLEADENLPKIEVVPQDIGRVLLNLINNAFFAVNEKVKHSENSYKPLVVVQTAKTLNGIEIRVNDNGPGIPDSVREKIFQPFYTTKPTGQGTGLGLSLSYDIVKAHGGELKLISDPATGTTFIITLNKE